MVVAQIVVAGEAVDALREATASAELLVIGRHSGKERDARSLGSRGPPAHQHGPMPNPGCAADSGRAPMTVSLGPLQSAMRGRDRRLRARANRSARARRSAFPRRHARRCAWSRLEPLARSVRLARPLRRPLRGRPRPSSSIVMVSSAAEAASAIDA